MSGSIQIRPATAADWPKIWAIIEVVLSRGDTYVWDWVDGAVARTVWMEKPRDVLVAIQDDAVVGTYILQDNQPGRGAHVANAAFMVAPNARRSGVGRTMAEDALERRQRWRCRVK